VFRNRTVRVVLNVTNYHHVTKVSTTTWPVRKRYLQKKGMLATITEEDG
jgi:hypothetical protein